MLLALCRLSNTTCTLIVTVAQSYQCTHTHPFKGPLSGTTRVSRYQKGKPIWILLKQETVSGSGISWYICKSAPCSRLITVLAPHHSVYRPAQIPWLGCMTGRTSSQWQPVPLSPTVSVLEQLEVEMEEEEEMTSVLLFCISGCVLLRIDV